MTRGGTLAFAWLVGIALILWFAQHKPTPAAAAEIRIDEPEAHRAAAPCTAAPQLPNPCDRVNCNRPDTRRLA